MKRKVKGFIKCLQSLFNVGESSNTNLNDEFCERFVWYICDEENFENSECMDLFDA